QMRIILDASVSTVKRLRVSLGTLVAIEATANVAVDGIALAGATAHQQIRANAAKHRVALAGTAATEVIPTALAESPAADLIATEILTAEAAIESAFEAVEQINR